MSRDLQSSQVPAFNADPLRILIVRTGAMGDILHGLPAVTALRNALPDSMIGWAIEPHWSPLLHSPLPTSGTQSNPLVDRLHLVPTREWKLRPFSFSTLRQIAALGRELRAQKYDVCVDLQGSIRSAFIGRISGSARFAGPRHPRERQARALYGERIDVGGAHVIAQACALVAAGANLDRLDPVLPSLPHDQPAEDWCEATLNARGISAPFLLLIPGAGWGAKRWPAAGFAELARLLGEQGFTVLSNASSDPEIDAQLESAGALPIRSTLAQLIALTRRAALVIGGDTGPVHLAATLRRPVLALFGPTDPQRTGPHFPGAHVSVLRHPDSIIDHRRHAQAESGLARLSVQEVFQAAMQMLAECRQGEPVHG